MPPEIQKIALMVNSAGTVNDLLTVVMSTEYNELVTKLDEHDRFIVSQAVVLREHQIKIHTLGEAIIELDSKVFELNSKVNQVMGKRK